MAYEENITPLTYIANADLSATPYRFVKLVNSSGAAKCDLAGAGDAVVGVLLDKPLAGEACRVASITGGGKCPLYFGGTITAGGEISATTNGAGLAQSSTNDCYAIAMSSGVSGDIHTVSLVYNNH